MEAMMKREAELKTKEDAASSTSTPVPPQSDANSSNNTDIDTGNKANINDTDNGNKTGASTSPLVGATGEGMNRSFTFSKVVLL